MLGKGKQLQHFLSDRAAKFTSLCLEPQVAQAPGASWEIWHPQWEQKVVTKPDTSKSGIREETGPNLVRALGMFSDSHTRTSHIE